MRLWSLHPAYLDAKGLVALWREGLLARKVLRHRTKGYRAHPQLERFKAQPDPLAAIDGYLHGVYLEAERRGYRFDRKKIGRYSLGNKIGVSDGQLAYEMRHLRRKLQLRGRARASDPAVSLKILNIEKEQFPRPHPIFKIIPGGIASWEKSC